MIKKKFLEKVKLLAITEAHKGPGIGKRAGFKVGAVLFSKNWIFEKRFNSYKTHPILAKFSEFPFSHAESSCIIHQGLDHCDGLYLFVTRITKHGTLTMAKPCNACVELIRAVKIREVYYTDWNGKINKLFKN